jgi:hypothetical protein
MADADAAQAIGNCPLSLVLADVCVRGWLRFAGTGRHAPCPQEQQAGCDEAALFVQAVQQHNQVRS